jgi:hypothetical protein
MICGDGGDLRGFYVNVVVVVVVVVVILEFFVFVLWY